MSSLKDRSNISTIFGINYED